MLINLSDVLSDQHKTVEETVPLTMEMIRLRSGDYPVVASEPVHVRAEHIKGKELLIKADTALTVLIPCDRCLEDVRYDFVINCTKHVDIGLSDAELTGVWMAVPVTEACVCLLALIFLFKKDRGSLS